MISVGIRTEVRKGLLAKAGGDMKTLTNGMGAVLTLALGSAIRGRVEGRADTGGQGAKTWDTRYKHTQISPRYPGVASKGKQGRSGARVFQNNDDFHREMGARPGSYSVSGEMWDGLSRIIITPTLVTLEFRGRSEGQQPNIRGGARRRVVSSKATHTPRHGVAQARGLKINNTLKAATVLNAHGVNVLALSEAELGAIGAGVTSAMALGIGSMLDVEWSGERVRGDTLEAIFESAFGASGRIQIRAAAV